jgi:hypothetical protein
MEEETLQQAKERLLIMPEKVRGEILLNHASFVKEKEGKGGLKKLEEKLKDLGAPVNFKKIKSLEWVKEGLSVLVILTAKEIFYWEERHIFEMGMSAPRFSLGLKMFVQNVVLPERLFEESPVYWNNLFNFGHVDPVEYNEKAQQAVLQIHDYKKTHPLICKYHAGYIHGLSQFALKTKKIEIEETKCIYRGDEYSEYVISWD